MDNAVDDLIETFGQASLGDEGQGPEQLLCEPPSSSKASKSLDDIPAYLFRVVFPLSAGKTDDIWARSESACQRTVSSTKDIFSFQHINDRQTKASELNVHLRWRGGSTPAEDNFVSWTSSLLFAIQYIYYRRHHDIPRPYINDVKLYIIDTTLFQRGTFIRDLDLIEEFREFDSGNSPGQYWNLRSLYSLRTGNSYYFGEYLSQGSLKIENKFTVIPASILFDDRRLCRVQPAFKNLYVPPPRNDPKWAKAVIDLRQEIWPSKLLVLSSVDILDRLAAIKEVLDSMSERDLKHRWRFPLGIYLAALIGPMPATESHTGNESIFFEHFRSATWAGQKPSDFKVVAPDTMPELKYTRKLLFETNQHFQLKEALSTVTKAERKIRTLYNQAPWPENEDFLVVADHNESLAQTGEQIESKLRSMRKLCDELVSKMAKHKAYAME